MAARAVWKGHLSIDGVDCGVALHTAISSSARLHFHIINRKTEHRVTRSYFDTSTGDAVEAEDLMRGYDMGGGDFVVLSPEDIAAAAPKSDKTLQVKGFIPCDQIDRLYFDRPYYLTPSSSADADYFAEIRDGLSKQKAAAVAQAVLFRRLRTVLIRAHSKGLIATLLNFDYEVRSPKQAFADIPEVEIKGEMLDLGQEIIKRMTGTFDPAAFTDRYESAMADLIQIKAKGGKIKPVKKKKTEKTTDLLEALRKSAAA
jgi:DNA end-binding protein Ku